MVGAFIYERELSQMKFIIFVAVVASGADVLSMNSQIIMLTPSL
jgi:hypothetical protein